MSTLSEEGIAAKCHELVYQVGYSFYDAPYILLLNLLVYSGPIGEKDLGSITALNGNELRKYLGMLIVHRLVKRHVNKEKVPVTDFTHAQRGQPNQGEGQMRMRDVSYYYIDYREFANVTKYRLAMMRKGIEGKLMQDVGHKGYICPYCSRTYATLESMHLFDPRTNTFQCEDDHTELIEHQPEDPGAGAGEAADKLQRFNQATAPIRDVLKDIEGVKVPSINMMAWIAKNVKVHVDLHEEEKDDKGKFSVVLGEGDERERIEKERLAEQQRVQNALPIWHTHSTVTGSKTALGIKDAAQEAARAAEASGITRVGDTDGDDEMLMQHYDGLADDDGDFGVATPADEGVRDISRNGGAEKDAVTPVQGIYANGGASKTLEDGEDSDEEEMAFTAQAPIAAATDSANTANQSVMVMIAGISKPLEDVTDEDQEMMTPDEYEAYYEAATA